MIPSTVDSANGSNLLSGLLIKSGFNKKPDLLLNSKIPKFNCMGKSENEINYNSHNVSRINKSLDFY